MLRIRPIGTMDELYTISEIWQQLYESDAHATIAQSWTWNLTWCEVILPVLGNAKPEVMLVEDGAGRVVAILPFFAEDVAGPLARFLRFTGYHMPVHYDIVTGEPDNPDLIREVIAALRAVLDGRTILHLRRLKSSSLFTRELAGRGLAHVQDTHLWIPADPEITDQSKRLGKSTRQTFRWQMNKLRKDHGVEYRIFSGAELDNAFEDHMRLHGLRWRNKDVETFIQRDQRNFLQAVSSQLARQGKCEIVQMWSGARAVASSLGLLDRGAYFGISSGFDPEYAKYSPMRLLLAEVIRRSFDELGCRVFDFGPGSDGYKLDWKPETGHSYYCCVPGNSVYAKGLAAVYHVLFKSRLKRRLRPGRAEKGAGGGR